MAGFVVEADIGRAEPEFGRLRLPRFEADPLEPARAADRLGDARDRVVDVELDGVVAGFAAGVGDVGGDFDARVAEPEAERIERDLAVPSERLDCPGVS